MVLTLEGWSAMGQEHHCRLRPWLHQVHRSPCWARDLPDHAALALMRWIHQRRSSPVGLLQWIASQHCQKRCPDDPRHHLPMRSALRQTVFLPLMSRTAASTAVPERRGPADAGSEPSWQPALPSTALALCGSAPGSPGWASSCPAACSSA